MMNFNLDGSQPSSRYFSYASMVIPRNDAFIGNGDLIASRYLTAWEAFREPISSFWEPRFAMQAPK